MNHSDVIKYWFSKKSREHWFFSTPEIDNEIKQRYEQLWTRAASGELKDWQDSPQGCLALIIVLDQFPLNMFRGKSKSSGERRGKSKPTKKENKSPFSGKRRRRDR